MQQELCAICDTPYLAEDFAYLAANVNEDGTKITGILGICQLSIDADGYVIYFVSMSAGDSTEIMIPNCVSDYTVSGTNDGGFIVVGRVNG